MFCYSRLMRIFLKRVGPPFEALGNLVPKYTSISRRSLIKLLPCLPYLSPGNMFLPFSDKGFLGSVERAIFSSNSKNCWDVDKNAITFFSFWQMIYLKVWVIGMQYLKCIEFGSSWFLGVFEIVIHIREEVLAKHFLEHFFRVKGIAEKELHS